MPRRISSHLLSSVSILAATAIATGATPAAQAQDAQCAESGGILLCPAGTDNDGAASATDGVIVTVESGATVRTVNDGVPALSITGEAPTITVQAGGEVRSVGDAAAALDAAAGSGGDITLAGTVASQGATSPAVALGAQSTLSLSADGTVSTDGDGADGVRAAADATVGLADGATIATNGDNAAGVALIGGGATLTVDEGAAITTNGVAPTVRVAAAGASVSNGGTLTAAVGPAITVADGLSGSAVTITNGAGGTIALGPEGSVAIDGGDGAEDVVNEGTINGGVSLAGGADSLTNGGTIAGTVSMGAGSDTLTNSGFIEGDALLGAGDDRYIQQGSGFVNGTINGGSGTNALIVTGDGSLDLSSQGNFQSLTVQGGFVDLLTTTDDSFDVGATTIANGATANVNTDNILRSSGGVTVEQGATLTGAGRIVGDVTSTGLIAPGDQSVNIQAAPPQVAGTLMIDGDFTQDFGGRLLFDIGGGQSDLVIVTGDVDLRGGGVTLSANEGADFATLGGETITLINGRGTTTSALQADAVIANGLGSDVFAVTPTLSVAGNDVVVDLSVQSDLDVGLNLFGRDRIIGEQLDRLFNFQSAPGDQIRQDVVAVANAGADTIPALSPEFYDGFIKAAVTMGDRTMEQIHTRLSAPKRELSGLWGSVLVERFDKDAGDRQFSEEYDFTQFNATVGYDLALADWIVVGGSVSYASAEVDVGGPAGEGDDGTVDSWSGSVYAGTTNRTGFNASASVGYQFNDIDATRPLRAGTITRDFDAEFEPGQLIAELRSDFTIEAGGFMVRPGVGVDFVVSDSETFEEQGGLGSLGLNVAAQGYEEMGGTARLDIFKPVGDDGRFFPYLGGFVRHNFQDDGREFAANFQAGTDIFRVVGQTERDEYGGRAGMTADFGVMRLDVSVEGRFGDDIDVVQGQVQAVLPF